MKVKIRSRMAEMANEHILPGDEPAYSTTTWEGELDLHGSVDSQLDQVFRFFNRVDGDDADRLEQLGYRLPSLSVRDEVTLDGETWVVMAVGFRRKGGE